MNQLAKSLSARLDSGEHRFSSLQAQSSHDGRAAAASQSHQQQQQHRFVQAQQFQQQFTKPSQQAQKSDQDPPVSPLQMSNDSRIASPQQTRQPMLTVPSIDMGLFRPNLGNSHNFTFQQQNQISTLAAKDGFPTPYDSVQNQAGNVTAHSSASNTEASGDLTDPEDSSNMIASIISKICFDLSSENQQQLQIAHTVGLRVYEALSGKMNQYKLEIQSLRRGIEAKNRRIQLLESLQQQQARQSIPQLQMSTATATNPAASRVSLPESVQPVTLTKQFKPSHSFTSFSPEMKQERKSAGTRRKSSSTSSRAKKKTKTSTNAKGLAKAKTSSSSSSSADIVNRWTQEQDNALKEAVKKYDGRNWKAIAQLVEGRDHVQCLQRWKKVLQPGLVKGHWTSEEDEKLLQLIKNKEMHSWAMVAENIEGRTAKQCRERWSLNLDPSINRSAWTMEEDALLLKLHAEIGGRWAEIKQQFDRRTENAVKTRYKSIMRAKAREWTPEQDQKLIDLRRAYGKDWAKIAKGLPGRSRNAIKVRSKTLAESDPVMRRIEYPHLENAATMNNMQVKGNVARKAEGKVRR